MARFSFTYGTIGKILNKTLDASIHAEEEKLGRPLMGVVRHLIAVPVFSLKPTTYSRYADIGYFSLVYFR